MYLFTTISTPHRRDWQHRSQNIEQGYMHDLKFEIVALGMRAFTDEPNCQECNGTRDRLRYLALQHTRSPSTPPVQVTPYDGSNPLVERRGKQHRRQPRHAEGLEA